MFLGKIETFVNGEGKRIDFLVPVPPSTEASQPKDLEKFIGHTIVGMTGLDGRVLGAQPISFPIEAETLDEAFENFEESARNFINEQREQHMGSKLILPSTSQTSQITH